MLDWTVFNAATVATTRSVLLADACATAWRCLHLPAESRPAAMAELVRDAPDAQTMTEALALVWRRLWREAGVDINDLAAFQAVVDDVAAGRATPAAADAVLRTASIITIKQALSERITGVVTAQSDADLDRLNDATPALSAAVDATGLGIVTAESLEALQRAIDAFEAVRGDLSTPSLREHAWWMGLAWWAMGRGAQELARHTEAGNAFECAAAHYDEAGEPGSAVKCRRLFNDLANRLRADTDAASLEDARALLESQDPLTRAATLARLSGEAGRAGDRFEAAALGEQAAVLLVALGYDDPEQDLDDAVQAWMATAAGPLTGNALFARLCEVTGHWAAVLGARSSDRLTRDPAGSARSERTLRGLATLPAEMSRQADDATRAALQRFAVWEPDIAARAPHRHDDAGERVASELHALDDGLHTLRVTCNEGASPALLDEADRLRERADALGSRVHATRASIERAYVLLALGRHDDVALAADAALQRLLDGKAARLGSFATAYERELYLTAITFKARVLAHRGDYRYLLETCTPVLRDLEAERRRVSDPYQQSAVLSTRTELYELVAAAALRAGEPDQLLATTELLKARASLARRRTTSDPDDESDTEREWHAVSERLLLATPGSPDAAALHERRRRLAALVALERGAAANLPAEITIAALTDALTDDEAAVSWFWASPDVLIVQAFTRDGRVATSVHLEAAHQRDLREYLEAVTALGRPAPEYRHLVPRLGELIDALGPVLIPPCVRDLVSGRRRLILSPHRTLHLFPFHAVRWDGAGGTARLVEQMAVRVVPNLTSVLLPWAGTHDGRALAVGVGRFDAPGAPPLPGAHTEATAIAAAHGAAGDLLLDADRATFLAQLDRASYRCLHLATHGSSVFANASIDDPLQSCLSFRDGDLTAWDIAALDIGAELVVLAACHSGQRAVSGRGLTWLPGDDLFGLQSVLFEAGVWGVLGTLWPVDDETAPELMGDVHRAYAAGQPPDEALQSAIRTHLRTPGRRKSAFYWAPFVLTTMGVRSADRDRSLARHCDGVVCGRAG